MRLLEVARLMDCHQHFFASDPELRSWLQYSPVQSSLAARLPAPAGHVDADRFADQRGFDSRQGDSISNSDSNSNLAARSVCRGSAGRGQPDVQKANLHGPTHPTVLHPKTAAEPRHQFELLTPRLRGPCRA